MLKKERIFKFGHNLFLLGRRQDGKKVYLEDFSWDCDWYWGGGYLEVFNKPKSDITEHYHLDGVINESKKNAFNAVNAFNAIKEHFLELVLTDDELWLFCDLMMSFYALKEAAEVIGKGGGHYTTHNKITADKALARTLNAIIKNEIIPAVHDLLQKGGE